MVALYVVKKLVRVTNCFAEITLSAMKQLGLENEILRFAQDDKSGGTSWKPRGQ